MLISYELSPLGFSSLVRCSLRATSSVAFAKLAWENDSKRRDWLICAWACLWLLLLLFFFFDKKHQKLWRTTWQDYEQTDHCGPSRSISISLMICFLICKHDMIFYPQSGLSYCGKSWPLKKNGSDITLTAGCSHLAFPVHLYMHPWWLLVTGSHFPALQILTYTCSKQHAGTKEFSEMHEEEICICHFCPL